MPPGQPPGPILIQVANAASARPTEDSDRGFDHGEETAMSGIIVSYDGTPNDDDALALGRLLAATGATLSLAYVRHSREYDPARERLAQHDAERRLEHGAVWLGEPDIPRHIVVSASTGEGLAKLAEELDASMIVFGSDYRTPPGRVEPGTSAQRLLDGGPVAIALAPAGFRVAGAAAIAVIAVAAEGSDSAPAETAEALASKLGASIADSAAAEGVDLIVVGSSPSAPGGHVALTGSGRYLIETARCPVLVVLKGKPVRFEGS
jgi:nucleotide-binding universal stress UspA family protein